MKSETIKIVPQYLFLVLCNRCNLSCGHCIQSSHPRADGQLDCAALVDWLSRAKLAGLIGVDFSGGEPLLADTFAVLLEDILERTGLEVTIASNLIAVETLSAKLLRRHASRINWRVALEGVNADSHDMIRAPGSFAALWRGIDYLQENDAAGFACSTIIRPGVLQQLPSIVELLAGSGFKRHNWICLLPFGRGREYTHWDLEPTIWFEDLRPLARDLSHRYNLEINLYGPIVSPRNPARNDMHLTNNNQFRALAAFVDGTVYCNCFIEAFVSPKTVGNLHDADFVSLMSYASQRFQEFKCTNCRFRFACFGIKLA